MNTKKYCLSPGSLLYLDFLKFSLIYKNINEITISDTAPLHIIADEMLYNNNTQNFYIESVTTLNDMRCALITELINMDFYNKKIPNHNYLSFSLIKNQNDSTDYSVKITLTNKKD